MKRTYEVLYIVKPTIIDNEVDQIVEALANVAKENGGEVLSCGKWDRRRLAYEINGYKDGVYCLMYLEAEGNMPAIITREFRISDDILRGMVTIVDTKYVDVTKVEGPKASVEAKETAVKPEAVIPTEAELEQFKSGEASATEKQIEVVEKETEVTEE